MPSIELLGYSESELQKMQTDLREELRDIEFCKEIVFVAYRTEVSGFFGERQAYLRVSTRNEVKARVLMERLKKYADVEFFKSEDIVFKAGQ